MFLLYFMRNSDIQIMIYKTTSISHFFGRVTCFHSQKMENKNDIHIF